MKGHPDLTVAKRSQALVVSIIKDLWSHGRYVDNKWLAMTHDSWAHVWVDVKTALTMREIDRQARELVEQWTGQDDEEFLRSEEVEGETLLGGEMRLRAPWKGRKDS